MIYQKFYSSILLIVISLGVNGHSRDLDSSEVLLVVGGITGTRCMMRNVVRNLEKTVPYPVVNVTYKSREGLQTCERNLHDQLENLQLHKYRRVHFFCFIMGGYVLSRVLEDYPIPNLGKVVLDRSPFQEEVSIEAQETFSKPVVKLLLGQTAVDIGKMNFRHINADTVGLLIETKPGILAHFLHNRRIAHKTEGKILTFKPSVMVSDYNDATYIHLSHTAMYSKIDSYTELIRNFIDTGRFFVINTFQTPPDDTVFYGVERDAICGRNEMIKYKKAAR
jgi:hypothetical protein